MFQTNPLTSFISNYCPQFLWSNMFQLPIVPIIREPGYCKDTSSILCVGKW